MFFCYTVYGPNNEAFYYRDFEETNEVFVLFLSKVCQIRPEQAEKLPLFTQNVVLLAHKL